MKKLLLTLLTFLIAVNVAYPQLAIRHRLATPRPADSLDIDYYSHKRGLQAGTMVFGINIPSPCLTAEQTSPNSA